MCPNRVDDLESRVMELEASVEGLTDELVECKVRIRELENALDEDLGFSTNRQGSNEKGTNDEPQEAAEAVKNEAADGEDNTEESEGDIIVA